VVREARASPVGRCPDRFVDVLEGILDHRALTALTRQQSDGRIVPLRAHYAVHGGEVEVQLAGILRFEGPVALYLTCRPSREAVVAIPSFTKLPKLLVLRLFVVDIL
jgi:hypothetical protein